jgi:hypothetical protein
MAGGKVPFCWEQSPSSTDGLSPCDTPPAGPLLRLQVRRPTPVCMPAYPLLPNVVCGDNGQKATQLREYISVVLPLWTSLGQWIHLWPNNSLAIIGLCQYITSYSLQPRDDVWIAPGKQTYSLWPYGLQSVTIG